MSETTPPDPFDPSEFTAEELHYAQELILARRQSAARPFTVGQRTFGETVSLSWNGCAGKNDTLTYSARGLPSCVSLNLDRIAPPHPDEEPTDASGWWTTLPMEDGDSEGPLPDQIVE